MITKGTRSVLSSVEVSWGVGAKLEHLGQLPENPLLVTLDVYRSRFINSGALAREARLPSTMGK